MTKRKLKLPTRTEFPDRTFSSQALNRALDSMNRKRLSTAAESLEKILVSPQLRSKAVNAVSWYLYDRADHPARRAREMGLPVRHDFAIIADVNSTLPSLSDQIISASTLAFDVVDRNSDVPNMPDTFDINEKVSALDAAIIDLRIELGKIKNAFIEDAIKDGSVIRQADHDTIVPKGRRKSAFSIARVRFLKRIIAIFLEAQPEEESAIIQKVYHAIIEDGLNLAAEGHWPTVGDIDALRGDKA